MKGAQPTLTEKTVAGAITRGRCPVCTAEHRIVKDGTLFPHGPWSNRCRGSYKPPTEEG